MRAEEGKEKTAKAAGKTARRAAAGGITPMEAAE
jgi:hypothetical protein